MSLSHSPSPSTSRVQSPQSSPKIPANCNLNLLKRMQQDTCYTCHQLGHWSWFCPSKSPKTKPISPSPKQDSTVSHNTSCSHGSSEVKPTVPSGRNYYACPIKRTHGSCGYGVTEDELLHSNSKSIDPIKQRRQRTLDDFWEGCQNYKGKGLQVENKRMRITESSENPSSMAVSEIPDKEGAGAALNAANSKHVDFPDLEVDDDDDEEFINSVSWDAIEEEAYLLSSRLSTPSRIRWRQIMFQRRIFPEVSCALNKSMEDSFTMEEHNKLFEEEKMRFAQLQDEYVQIKALFEALNQHTQLLCEQVSNLKTMLHVKQNQLKFCELETLKIKTHLDVVKRSMLETNITLKERVDPSEELQEKQVTTKTTLENVRDH